MAEPNPPLLTRKCLVGATEESPSGTRATVTAPLDNTTIYDAKCEVQDMHSDGARLANGHYMGSYSSIAGKPIGKLTYRQEMRYGDMFAVMLTGANFKLVTATYKPNTSWATADRKTWTLVLWEDGRRKEIYGAVANVTLEGAAGGRVFANWEWTGIWVAPIDEAMPAQAPSEHTTAVYNVRGVTLTIGSVVMPHWGKFTVTPGNTIEERPNGTAATGLAHFFVASRAPRVTLDTESRTVALGAPFAALLAGTEAALNLVLTDGGTPANTLTITAPKLQIIAVSNGDAGGRLLDERTYQCNVSSGDDELTFLPAAGA